MPGGTSVGGKNTVRSTHTEDGEESKDSTREEEEEDATTQTKRENKWSGQGGGGSYLFELNISLHVRFLFCAKFVEKFFDMWSRQVALILTKALQKQTQRCAAQQRLHPAGLTE